MMMKEKTFYVSRGNKIILYLVGKTDTNLVFLALEARESFAQRKLERNRTNLLKLHTQFALIATENLILWESSLKS